MNDVIVRLIAMPLSVRAFTVPDEQGDYNIYLNEALSDEQLQKSCIMITMNEVKKQKQKTLYSHTPNFIFSHL